MELKSSTGRIAWSNLRLEPLQCHTSIPSSSQAVLSVLFLMERFRWSDKAFRMRRVAKVLLQSLSSHTIQDILVSGRSNVFTSNVGYHSLTARGLGARYCFLFDFRSTGYATYAC